MISAIFFSFFLKFLLFKFELSAKCNTVSLNVYWLLAPTGMFEQCSLSMGSPKLGAAAAYMCVVGPAPRLLAVRPVWVHTHNL